MTYLLPILLGFLTHKQGMCTSKLVYNAGWKILADVYLMYRWMHEGIDAFKAGI